MIAVRTSAKRLRIDALISFLELEGPLWMGSSARGGLYLLYSPRIFPVLSVARIVNFPFDKISAGIGRFG